MSLSHLYNDFTPMTAPSPMAAQPAPDADAREDARLASFEEGYKAGWEDAARAKDAENNRLTEEFVQQLQDMSFSYHEAFTKLTAATAPLMTDFVLKLLPKAAHGALAAQLADQLAELIGKQTEKSVELAVAPERVDQITALLADTIDIPFHVVAETALSSHQVYLRVSGKEREINLDTVLDGINQAVDAYLNSAIPEP